MWFIALKDAEKCAFWLFLSIYHELFGHNGRKRNSMFNQLNLDDRLKSAEHFETRQIRIYRVN